MCGAYLFTLSVFLLINVVNSFGGLRLFKTSAHVSHLWGGGGFSSKDKEIKKSPKGSERLPETIGDSNPETIHRSIAKHIPTCDLEYPKLKSLYGDPPIITVDDFFDYVTCQNYIIRAQELGKQISSQTFSSGSTRTSTTWHMKYQDVPELLYYASKLTGVSPLHFEEPQIVRYELGQQFSWHYDSIPTSLRCCSGNRLGTLIVYVMGIDIYVSYLLLSYSMVTLALHNIIILIVTHLYNNNP